MKFFLIQTENGIIVHDFVFTLTESIKYTNWYRNEKVYSYILSDYPVLPEGLLIKDVVPVGSIEYVLSYAEKYYGILNLKPLNIPEVLNRPEYVKRKIWNYNRTEKEKYRDMFVFAKSKDKYKGFTDCLPYNKIPDINENLYISEYIEDIVSEWRAFVFRDKLVGLQYYGGDFTTFPDVYLIEQIIKSYSPAPPAYTLDVGISKERGTLLIECHEFFSCGLYGFSDHTVLPKMFIATWNNIIGKTKLKVI